MAGRHLPQASLVIAGVALAVTVAQRRSPHAQRATAVLAVLGYRVVNYWLPLLPGAAATPA